MKTTVIKCDVCGSVDPQHVNEEIPVIWTVEDTEGRATKPYLQINHLDICQRCLDFICDGHFLYCDSVDRFKFRD